MFVCIPTYIYICVHENMCAALKYAGRKHSSQKVEMTEEKYCCQLLLRQTAAPRHHSTECALNFLFLTVFVSLND